MIIRVIGTGIRGFSQLTLEAVAQLQESKKFFYFGQTDSYFNHLALEHAESLSKLYRDGDLDTANYRRILGHILEQGAQFGDVAVLMPGHPRIGVTLVQWLQKMAPEKGIDLRVFEGISSFDTMINDLDRDPLEKGSIVCEANRLVLFNYKIDPTFDVYIYHVCSVGTAETNYSDARKNNQLGELKAYLLQYYPAETVAKLVSSSAETPQCPTIRQTTIGALDAVLPQITFSSTLFIPGARPQSINRAFLKMIGPTC